MPGVAVFAAMVAGFVLGWMACFLLAAWLPPRHRLAMPEKPIAPPKVSSPKPPPSAGRGDAPPPPKPPPIQVVVAGRVPPE